MSIFRVIEKSLKNGFISKKVGKYLNRRGFEEGSKRVRLG